MGNAKESAPDYAGHSGAQWEYEVEETSYGYYYSVYDERDQRLTEPYIDERAARLIAAAPQMLAALLAVKKIVDDAAERPTGFLVADFQTATYPNSRDAYDGLCAAIAKAEGR